MLSEGKNIDQVFREKSEAFNPGRGSLETDWAGISNQLPALEKRRRPVVIWLRSAAAVAAVVLLFFTIKGLVNNRAAENKTVQQPVAKQDTPVPPPVVPDTTLAVPSLNIDSFIASLKLDPIHISFEWPQPDVPAYSADTARAEASDTPVQRPAYEIMAEFNEQVAVAPQSYTISNNRDNTLNFKKGTSIFIPANTFYAGGQLINGEVTFSVTEYYTLGEMAAAKLNTTASGQMLKSGGMLFIKAMYNNQEVDAELKKELVVNMPATKGYDNEMELFLPATTEQPVGRLNLNTNNYDNAAPAGVAANTFEWAPAGQVQYQSTFRSNDFVENLPDVRVPTIEVVQPWKVIERTNTAVFLTDHLDVQEEAGMKAKLKEKFPQYTIKLRNTFIGRKRFVKTEDQGQNISKVRKLEANAYNLYSLAYGPKKGLPVFIGSLNDSIFVPFASAARRGLVSRQDSIRYARLEELRRVVNTGMDTLAKRYRFSLKQLGWINCDRFYSDQREKAPLYVQLPGDLSDYSVHVIFPKINAIMGMPALTENGFMFMNVPIGEPIYIVVVGMRNRKVLLGFKKANTGKEPIKDIPLEETDAEAYKRKLTELN